MDVKGHHRCLAEIGNGGVKVIDLAAGRADYIAVSDKLFTNPRQCGDTPYSRGDVASARKKLHKEREIVVRRYTEPTVFAVGDEDGRPSSVTT